MQVRQDFCKVPHQIGQERTDDLRREMGRRVGRTANEEDGEEKLEKKRASAETIALWASVSVTLASTSRRSEASGSASSAITPKRAAAHGMTI